MELKAHRIKDGVGLEIVPSHPQRDWMGETIVPQTAEDFAKRGEKRGFANRCLPMLMANQLGWTIRTTQHYVITTLPNEEFVAIYPDGEELQGPHRNFGHNIVTWEVPWVFETPPGWDLWITSPPNYQLPNGATCLSGVAETDHAHQTFTLNWKLPPLTTVVFQKHQPIANIVPFPTALLGDWTLVEDDVKPDGYDEFVAKRAESNNRFGPHWGRWDKDYWNDAKRRKLKNGMVRDSDGGPTSCGN